MTFSKKTKGTEVGCKTSGLVLKGDIKYILAKIGNL